jgi:hypothetical protein
MRRDRKTISRSIFRLACPRIKSKIVMALVPRTRRPFLKTMRPIKANEGVFLTTLKSAIVSSQKSRPKKQRQVITYGTDTEVARRTGSPHWSSSSKNRAGESVSKIACFLKGDTLEEDDDT